MKQIGIMIILETINNQTGDKNALRNRSSNITYRNYRSDKIHHAHQRK